MKNKTKYSEFNEKSNENYENVNYVLYTKNYVKIVENCQKKVA